MWGAAPSLSQVVTAIELLLRELPRAPRRREGWDDKYEGGEPPWFTETLDEDIAEILRGVGGGRLLDLGAGPGTLAIFAADHGFEVTALDTSGAALALARKRADKRSIAWVLGDVLDPPPLAEFDVATDRGCLHCLPRSEWPRYAATMARAVRRGGLLILKEHAPEEGGKHGTSPPSAEELAEILGPAFAMKQWRASTFAGKIAPAPSAILSVWVRQ